MNFLVLMSDEHRRDAMGCAGHPIVQTPTLDRLAARGTRFANAYTPSPMCVPARAAIATGDYVHRTGHWDSAAPYAGAPQSWMHDLREAGVPARAFGKLHFRSSEDDNGWTEEVLPMHVLHGIGWTRGLLRGEGERYPDTGELAADVGEGVSEYFDYDRRVTDAACAWLTQSGGAGPWAAFVSLVSPHFPLKAPKEFLDLYDPGRMDPPIASAPSDRPTHPEMRELAEFFDYGAYFDDRKQREARAAYYALVTSLDANLARVLGALEASGALDETLVIYASDHGEMLGDHGFWTKQVMYEASVGAPLVATGPGIPVGRVCETPASLLDLHPTARITQGLGPDPHLPGDSLLALANAPDNPDRTVMAEYHDGGSTTAAFMIRWDRWKYIHFAGQAPLLFDLAADPSERRDLASDPAHGPIVVEGRRRLDDICDPDAVNAEAFADQARRIERLGGRKACTATFGHTPVPGTGR